MEPNELIVKKLDLAQIRPNDDPVETEKGGFKLSIIGKPGLGKSTLIKQIIYSKRFLIPVAVIFSGTEELNGFYKDMFPKCFIYNTFNPEILEKVFTRQKYAKQHLPNSWLLLIFDDCMNDPRQFHHKNMLTLFKNGRHYNILAIFTNQYVLDFKPEIRTSLDGIFLFKEQNSTTLAKLYNNFGGIMPDKKTFTNVLKQVTQEPYTCMYIDNSSCNTKPWEECIYWYKAETVPDFTFGSGLYRNINKCKK